LTTPSNISSKLFHYLYRMYWNQPHEEVQKEIRETVAAIKKASEAARRTPETARKFLVDAGIIKERGNKKSPQCRRGPVTLGGGSQGATAK
jgi:hypothetical protein